MKKILGLSLINTCLGAGATAAIAAYRYIKETFR